jgi:hypothetical protein
MTFAVVPYNHDGSIPPGVKPELAEVGEKARVADWSSWDARFGPLLSGEAFADLPRARQPVAHFFFPYNLMWPSDMRNWKKPAYRAEHLRISEDFRRHLLRARGPEGHSDWQGRLHAEEDWHRLTPADRADAGNKGISGTVRESSSRLARRARIHRCSRLATSI